MQIHVVPKYIFYQFTNIFQLERPSSTSKVLTKTKISLLRDCAYLFYSVSCPVPVLFSLKQHSNLARHHIWRSWRTSASFLTMSSRSTNTHAKWKEENNFSPIYSNKWVHFARNIGFYLADPLSADSVDEFQSVFFIKSNPKTCAK